MKKVVTAVGNRLARKPSPKLIAKLKEAEKALEDASKEYEELHKAVPEANKIIREISDLTGRVPEAAAKLKIGNALLKLAPLLAGSKIGQGILRTGKILTNPAFSNPVTNCS